MNATIEITDTAATPADAAPNIVIIYQDRATGIRAKLFAEMLASALGDESYCTMAFWRCELIELPAGRLEPVEEPVSCAARELEEEIGVRAGRLIHQVSSMSEPRSSRVGAAHSM